MPDRPTPPESVAAELAHDETASVLAGQADVVDAVLAANRVFVAVAASALAELSPEVTMPQFRALVLLDMHERMSLSDLADALGVVPSTATRMCDRLVAKQLVDRVVDGANRRQVSLTLRGEGRELIEHSTRRRTHEVGRLLEAIPMGSQSELAHALGLLVQAAHASDRTRPSRDRPSTGPGRPGQDGVR